MLLACLKQFARCPCPRCRINKDKIIEMGTSNDLLRRNWVRQDTNDVNYRIKMARRWVFEDGMPLTSVYMARVLDPLSLTPTRVSCMGISITRLNLMNNTVGLLYPTARARVQLLLFVCARSHARVRARCLEINLDTLPSHSVRSRRG